jgi:D-beta-D-heptose 7-phosphate kinase/D-beta-D-heptose 1-phosphate adenosyltransferase
MPTVRQAGKLLRSYRGRTVLVVGDLMLDRYVTGIVSRISPEAPVPVVHVQGERATPGGAANVALNIQSLGGQAIVAGAVGRDADGRALMKALAECGIRTDGVVVSAAIQTVVKTRVLADRQQVVRVDREDPPERMAGIRKRLQAGLERALRRAEGVIIEDYGKGVVTQNVVECIMSAASRRELRIGLDPKDDSALKFSRITLATPNYAEACAAAGLKPEPLAGDLTRHATLARAGRILREKWNCEMLAITLGAHGMYLTNGKRKPRVIPAKAREVFDVCGAGDTVIAAVMLGLASGASLDEAAALANVAAGVVVGKIGTATCTPRELLAYMRRWE